MSINTYQAGIAMIAVSVASSAGALILVRRVGAFRRLIVTHEACGQYLSVVGTLYAVLLGLIVVDAMERRQLAMTLVEKECTSFAEIIYLAGRMPAALKVDVHRRAVDYANLVIHDEWPMMAHAQFHPAARISALELMRVVRDWEPATESEKAVYATVLPAASDFWSARQQRILACRRRIPVLEWIAVIVGGIVTVGMTYFLVLDDLRIQVILTALVAVVISLNIFLIVMFGYPFAGELHIGSEGFDVVLKALRPEENALFSR